jgi:hypothetical protein
MREDLLGGSHEEKKHSKAYSERLSCLKSTEILEIAIFLPGKAFFRKKILTISLEFFLKLNSQPGDGHISLICRLYVYTLFCKVCQNKT